MITRFVIGGLVGILLLSLSGLYKIGFDVNAKRCTQHCKYYRQYPVIKIDFSRIPIFSCTCTETKP